jgi:hypothetical protein
LKAAAMLRFLCHRVGAALVVSLGLTACQEDGPVLPAATIKHVMETVAVPSGKVVFDAAAEAPATEAGWTAVQTNALAISDSADRLIRSVRGGNRGPWTELAKAMAAAADRVAAAAAARDANGLAAAGDALYGTCEGCHKVFQSKVKESRS